MNAYKKNQWKIVGRQDIYLVPKYHSMNYLLYNEEIEQLSNLAP